MRLERRLAMTGTSAIKMPVFEGRPATMDDGGHIVLDGASNVRYVTWVLGARAPATGCVLRSANLDQLSAAGRRRFGELRVAIVIDLRGKAEAAAAPQLDGATRIHLPI